MPDDPTIIQRNKSDDEAILPNGIATSPISPTSADNPASPTDSVIICEAYL